MFNELNPRPTVTRQEPLQLPVAARLAVAQPLAPAKPEKVAILDNKDSPLDISKPIYYNPVVICTEAIEREGLGLCQNYCIVN
jgi:hypothetical protein